jgi:hypothetical protein
MNVGLAKTTGDDMERPGIDSNQMLTIRTPSTTMPIPIRLEYLLKQTLMDLLKSDPGE